LKTLETVAALRSELEPYRFAGKTIGLVPTMGALHAGHLSLIDRSRKETDVTVVSIFVNPKQFGPSEDFSKYPRTPEVDADLLRNAGVDILFHPSAIEMYPAGDSTSITVKGITDEFEGAIRPGHFDGVATVVAKLFNQVQPNIAFFGQKDAQQVAVIKQMVRDLQFPIKLRVGETVRERDGLALSSRNQYLSQKQHIEATGVIATLQRVSIALGLGKDIKSALSDASHYFSITCPDASLDYLEVVNIETFCKMDSFKGVEKLLVIIAARFGATRLLDNLIIDRPTTE
jgi:pantoate--beta-alanine ligase